MGELVDCDQEHLNLLKLSYYILAGTTGFVSLIAVLYIGLGALFASGVLPSTPNDAGNTRIMGLIFLSIGLVVMLISVAITFLTYWAGRCLRDRRHRTFCVVPACALRHGHRRMHHHRAGPAQRPGAIRNASSGLNRERRQALVPVVQWQARGLWRHAPCCESKPGRQTRVA
jgi:hypothetical protein